MEDDVAIVTITDPATHEIICSSELSGDDCDHFIATIKEDLYPDCLVTVDYLYSRQMDLF